MQPKNRVLTVVLSALLIFQLFQLPIIASAYDGTSPISTDIVYVADISGSADETDSEGFLGDALTLGVDLAPENSRVAVIAVNHEVISETPLTDVSAKDGRNTLKDYVHQIQNSGDTNFPVGLSRAIEMLKASYAEQKRIIFIGDFKEGGYNAGLQGGEGEAVNLIETVSATAKGSGVAIDMILWEEPPKNSAIAHDILALPQQTGGRLFEMSDTSRVPACVEEIYLQNFSYQYSVINVRGNSGQALNIPMPTNNVRRARVFVSASSPAAAFGASYSGADIDGEQNRSYSMVDLVNPPIDGINITLSPGENGNANIYTIVEYDPIELAVSLESNSFLASEEDLEETQSSVIHAEIVDAKTGKPLLAAPYTEGAVFKLEVTPPNGAAADTYSHGDPTSYSFSPDSAEEFGTYQITAELVAGGITFGPLTATVDVPDIRQPVPIEEPTNWPLIIAIIVGSLLILAALIIALRIRKKAIEYQGAAEMASDYRFHGKLSVYAVILDGGEREIRPFDFSLHCIGEKRITLRQILDSVGANDAYPGAEDILFLVGPEESVVMRNNSNATVRVMGRNYEYRTKAQIFYDQKCHVVFGKDENEIELVYRKVREEDAAPVHFNIRSRRTSASI